MAKHTQITSEQAIKIMELNRESVDSRDIADFIGVSQSYISNFIRAYNGNEVRLKVFNQNTQKIIKETSPFYNPNKLEQKIESNKYRVKMFFGLIKFTIEKI